MSTNKKTTRFEKKERFLDSVENEKSLAKVDKTKQGTHIRPHFELHTQSSLLKRKDSKQCVTRNLKRFQKSEGSRVCKRRSQVTKQSKSMQALKTILMQEKDSCEIFASLSELVKTVHSSEDCSKNSLAPFQSDSIESMYRDCAKWREYLIKSEFDPKDEIAQTGKHLGKSHASSREDQASKHTCDIQRGAANSHTSASLQGNSTRNAFISTENHPFVEIQRGNRLHSSNDEPEDACCKIKFHHVPLKLEKSLERKSEDNSSNKEYSIETQVRQYVLPNVTCRNRAWETWSSKQAAIQSEDVAGVDYSCDFNLEDAEITKFVKQVDDTQPQVTSDVRMLGKRKCTSRRSNFAPNLPVLKPAGVNKASIMKSTTSLTQKSSRSMVKSIASESNQQRSKYSSREYAKSLDNESTKVLKSIRRSKLPMKENMDPYANRALKLCEHLVENRRTKDVKQREMSNGGTLLKKKRPTTKLLCYPSSNLTLVSDKCNDAKWGGLRSRSKSKSKSQHWQSRSATSKKPSKSREDIDDVRSESAYQKKSRPLEVMCKLKEIINSLKDNKNVGENAEVSESEETWKLIRTIGTQTLSRCKKNVVVETECNMIPYETFYKNAEISCDLVGSTNSKTNADSSVIEDELVSEDISIHTIVGLRPVVKTDDESECPDIKEKLSISEHDKTLTRDSIELESCISAGTIATSAETIVTNHVFATETKTIISKDEVHEDEISLKLSGNHGDSMKAATDEQKKSTECSNDYGAIGGSANDLFSKKSRWTLLSLYDYDASCSDSSEEVMEHLEDDVRHENAVVPKLGVNSIPNDVFVAFQIAAKYARNLYKAVLLYNESLMSQQSKKQSKATSVDRRTSMLEEDRCRIHKSASFLSCRSDDRLKSEYNMKYELIITSDEDLDRFSERSSSRNSSLHSHQLGLQNFRTDRINCPEISLKEEKTILPQSVETSMELVQRRSDLMLVDVKSFVRLVCRTQENHTLEVLKLEELAEDGKLQDDGKANGTVALSVMELISVMSREHFVPLIYCLFCTLVFWYLQFSFTCNSNQ